MRRFEGLPKLGKCGSNRPGKLIGTGSWQHTLGSTHKQRIFETNPQPPNGVAEGRLTEPYPSRGPADMPLVDESFKGEEEVQIDSTDIHGVNTSYYNYQLHR